jgi:Xaa-Pro aminopeptidase
MDKILRKPVETSDDDLDPHYGWGRALPAWGTMGVDFELRVDFDRLRRYRIGRAKQALENSKLGALLLFDVNNIRYVTSTKIGEWERDKLCRFALLPKGGEPILWDFGSAAVHHRLYSPWLLKEHCRAGVIGMRGTIPPAFGLMKHYAEEIASLLREAGVAKEAVGVDIVEPPMMFELEKAGLKIADG